MLAGGGIAYVARLLSLQYDEGAILAGLQARFRERYTPQGGRALIGRAQQARAAAAEMQALPSGQRLPFGEIPWGQENRYGVRYVVNVTIRVPGEDRPVVKTVVIREPTTISRAQLAAEVHDLAQSLVGHQPRAEGSRDVVQGVVEEEFEIVSIERA